MRICKYFVDFLNCGFYRQGYPLRAITYEKIFSLFKFYFLKNWNTKIICYAWVNCGFEYYNIFFLIIFEIFEQTSFSERSGFYFYK